MNWQWLENPWVIGIIGSIPGGLLVNWVTGLVLGKRENREYLQKINGANREVIYAIRPGISEGQVPTPDVLSSLINATARRYGVEASDLYTPAQIAEELVKEVMDSSFISSAQKNEYCARLAELSGRSKQKEPVVPAKEVQPRTAAEYRQRLISAMSMMLGVLTVAMTAVYSLLDAVRWKRLDGMLSGGDETKIESFVPVLAAMITMTVSLLAMMVYRDLMRRRRESDAHESADLFRLITKSKRPSKISEPPK